MPRSTKKGVDHKVPLERRPTTNTGAHMEDTRMPRVKPDAGAESYRKMHRPAKVKGSG